MWIPVFRSSVWKIITSFYTNSRVSVEQFFVITGIVLLRRYMPINGLGKEFGSSHIKQSLFFFLGLKMGYSIPPTLFMSAFTLALC